MRVLVTGDRNWADQPFLVAALDAFHLTDPITLLIEGCANGADRMAGAHDRDRSPGAARLEPGWARTRGVEAAHFPAQWHLYSQPGRRNPAGPIRNQKMLDEGQPEYGIAFHDDLPNSRGTGDMVRRLIAAGVPVRHYSHAGTEDL